MKKLSLKLGSMEGWGNRCTGGMINGFRLRKQMEKGNGCHGMINRWGTEQRVDGMGRGKKGDWRGDRVDGGRE